MATVGIKGLSDFPSNSLQTKPFHLLAPIGCITYIVLVQT